MVGKAINSGKGSGYTNTWKTDSLKNTANAKTFGAHLEAAINKTGVPSSWGKYLAELFGRESGWDPTAKNPNSTAHGYAQFLSSTRSDYEKRYGIPYTTPVNQLILGIQYVKDRYGDPIKALKFWDQKKWY